MRRRDFITLLGGATAGWPLAARAQQPAKVYRIAIVSAATPVAEMSETGFLSTLFKELRRLGYVEGQNLVVERYSGAGRTEHYAELAREAVQLKPDLILVGSNPMVLHFKAATATIPIVGVMGDPVVTGLVGSLARPGGNITGVSIDAGVGIWSKRIEFVREMVPRASRVGVLGTRFGWENAAGIVAALREAAGRMGMSLIGTPLDGTIQEVEYRRVFEAMSQERPDALIVGADTENLVNRQLIVQLAEKARLPAIYPFREFVEIGGLIAYATDFVEFYRRAAGCVDQILKGAKPGEIPIYQMTKFELIINVKAAKAIGLTIPPGLLLRADEVIE